MRSEHGLNGSWQTWATHTIGGLEAGQKNLHHRITDTRQAAFQDLMHVRREMHGRLVYLEKQRRRTPEWVRHVPWLKILALLVLALMVLTGHITGGELKAWLLKRIEGF
jgi:hypothetical protein